LADPDRLPSLGAMNRRARRLLLVLALAAGPAPGPAAPVQDPAPRIHIAGDSTAADKETTPANPERGWGQMLPRFLRDPGMVVNHARNGRSTRSFLAEGRWQALVDALRPGDWVLIQFGHNDAKAEDPVRHAAPRGEYTDTLRRFVREVRGRGAHPVLCTPVARRSWDEAGTLRETHGDHPAAVRDLARAEGVPLLDLLALTRTLEASHGVEGSRRLHLWIPAGAYARKPDGWQDDTHYSAYGAERVAALVIEEILRQRLPLQAWVR
jgi:lysophospholipase L1-like esterase